MGIAERHIRPGDLTSPEVLGRHVIDLTFFEDQRQVPATFFRRRLSAADVLKTASSDEDSWR